MGNTPAVSEGKGRKLEGILAGAQAARGSTQRRGAALPSPVDAQSVLRRYPRLYELVKAIIKPTLELHGWRRSVPDPRTHTVLDLGCGTACLHPEVINVDLLPRPHVDIVTDLMEPLPLREGSVDAVVSISVLEHLERPEFLVAEVVRVLKPGGIFYFTTPLLYPYHAAPDDFRRWTLPGLRLLLGEDFELLRSGPKGGPMGVIILAVAHMAAQLLCCGSYTLYKTVNFAAMGMLWPLKLLDLVSMSLPFSTVLSPCIHVTARKCRKEEGDG